MNQTRRGFLRSTAALASFPVVSAFGATRLGQGPPTIRTIAGTGVAGVAAEGDIADEATINNIYGVLIGPDGRLFWCDLGTHRILAMDLGTRRISIIAGNATEGYSGDGGPAVEAQLSTPHELRFDMNGDMVFCERDNHVVRKVDMERGTISTVAGNGERGFAGDRGPASASQLAQPHSIAFDAADNLYICDIANQRVRRIDPVTGVITTFAGTGERGPAPDSGNLLDSALTGPRSIDVAPDGTMYLILREGNAVYEVDIDGGTFQRLAGTGELAYTGDGGPALEASFGREGNPLNGPKGIGYALDRKLYIVDTENHAIRVIDLDTGIVDTVAGTGERGDGPDGGPLQCRMARPHGVFVTGNQIYIGDSENHRIRLLEV
jgi:sugar lactone lactonase YvrE